MNIALLEAIHGFSIQQQSVEIMRNRRIFPKSFLRIDLSHFQDS